METGNKIVAIGMSGGVDSTVAAMLLKRQGFIVVGLTMQIWDNSFPCTATKSGCYGPNEVNNIEDAKRAAARLGIDHHVIDLRNEYRDVVIEYFRQEYAGGRTPNPCIMCNTRIKFSALLEKAQASGISFDLFATGHYARVSFDTLSGRYLLKRGIDTSKDQSYFLYRLTQRQLASVLFPLGGLKKEEVRVMAKEAGFEECLMRQESQDFLEWDDYGILLDGGGKPGNIVDEEGNVIGRHKGIGRYTVGQRRLLNLAGMKEPYYVLRIDTKRNEIVAGPKRSLIHWTLIAEDLHWLIPFNELKYKKLSAQIRYRSMSTQCEVAMMEDETVKVIFVNPQEAITPGQSVVFYEDDIVVGGGIIKGVVENK